MKASTLKNPSRVIVATLFTVLVATIVSAPAHAQEYTSPGYINFYTNGWATDQVRVTTTAPPINPAGCPFTDGYITNPSEPGNHTFEAALLETFLASSPKHVEIIVSNTTCYLGRPEIIGVTIKP